jgi:glutathione synthase/RimK-type ligase-like ATP-grasp enzyme
MRTGSSPGVKPGHESSRRLVIGVFADERSDRPPYGEQNTFFERLYAGAERMGISLYSFSIGQPYTSSRRLVVRRPAGPWPASIAPFPHVVYDRSLFEKASERRSARALKAVFASNGIPIFNPVIGHKLVIHRYLQSRPDTKSCLPETQEVDNLGTVFRLLRKWGDVYLTPAVGTQGRGVLRVRRLSHRFRASGFTNRLRHIECTDLGEKDLAKLLKSTIGSRRYLVQQTVDSVIWDGRRTDVRALVQRDGRGVWRVTGVAARVAVDRGDVCNLHRGGRPVTLEALLREMERARSVASERTHAELIRTALVVSRALTLRYPLLGELGLDFVIDKNGGIRLIEANPRPGRSIFRVLGMDEAAEKSVERPLEYAAYLVSAKPGGKSVVSYRTQSDRRG